jgi:hypothetical protein
MATLTSKKAHNWVDRGDPADPIIQRMLAHLFGLLPIEENRHRLALPATTLIAMVAADATEVHLVGYLRSAARELGVDDTTLPALRVHAIAMWHVAKVALVRDFAERVLSGEIPPNDPTPEPLNEWLAARLLSADELAEFEREGRAAEAGDSGIE